ncbi:MAG: ribosome hibernation-promoting factor, HPF/YfiA family [Egibacteraceae bacterium]
MDIIVKAKNCEVPVRLKEDAVSKVAHATRFYDRVQDIEMVFSEDHNPRIAEPAHVELTARTKRHLIRALGSAGDHRGAVDVAVERFERQLARYKARLIDRSRKRKRQKPVVGYVDNGVGELAVVPQDSWPSPKIVRTKQFQLAPMLPEDAAVQLELLNHDFFLFTHSETGRCNVVYRRRDGDLGLIEAAG